MSDRPKPMSKDTMIDVVSSMFDRDMLIRMTLEAKDAEIAELRAKLEAAKSKPPTKHDGKLPASSELSTDGEVRWEGSFISIRCGHNITMLDRKQGTLLLSWLQQEQERGRMAKEQEHVDSA